MGFFVCDCYCWFCCFNPEEHVTGQVCTLLFLKENVLTMLRKIPLVRFSRT